MKRAAIALFWGKGAFGIRVYGIPSASHAPVGREVPSVEGYALLDYPRTFTIALRMRVGEAAWQGA